MSATWTAFARELAAASIFFISNGQQGGLLPVAAGVALDRKLAGKKAVVVSFIGEGTLGEGVVYETANITNLWNLPHLIVCENNGYSQSTPQSVSVAGDIGARAEAFGARVFKADTWDLETLDETAAQALEYVRNTSRPALMIVQTYRLNPHSKGDDQRALEEIKWFSIRDPVNVAIRDVEGFAETYADIAAEVSSHIAAAMGKPRLSLNDYRVDQLPRADGAIQWSSCEPASGGRGAQQLNEFYGDWLDTTPRGLSWRRYCRPLWRRLQGQQGIYHAIPGAGADDADQRSRDTGSESAWFLPDAAPLSRSCLAISSPSLSTRSSTTRRNSFICTTASSADRSSCERRWGAPRLWSDPFPVARAISVGIDNCCLISPNS